MQASKLANSRSSFGRGIKAASWNSASVDCLIECDWEVFVIRRDEETGGFSTQTACCEEGLASDN